MLLGREPYHTRQGKANGELASRTGSVRRFDNLYVLGLSFLARSIAEDCGDYGCEKYYKADDYDELEEKKKHGTRDKKRLLHYCNDQKD